MIVLLLSSCTRQGASSRPADFNVRYEWRAGALAAPHGYKYTINLGPQMRGRMILRVYGVKNAPSWTESFPLQASDLDKLYATMVENRVFTRDWHQLTNFPTGQSTHLLAATADGVRYSIPAHPQSEVERTAAQRVYAAVEVLVPAAVRNRLNRRRREWAAQFQRKQ